MIWLQPQRLLNALLAAWLVCSPGGAEAENLLANLKAAYIYNFTRFIQWPDRGVGEWFDVVVVGAPELVEPLRALERGNKRTAGRPFRVRTGSGEHDLRDCEILLIGREAVTQGPSLLAEAAGKPILVITDLPEHAGQGAGISFVLRPDILGQGERLRFQINRNALRANGLAVSAQLLDVGEVLP